MAELVADNGARFTIQQEAGLVGRHAEDPSIQDPDVDLGGLEGGRTVSRRHVRIYRSGADWYLKVQTEARNATVVAGQLMLPEQETRLQDGDEIKLGVVTVVFRADSEPPLVGSNATMVRSASAPAELRSGDQHFPLAVAEGGTLSLGRHSDDGKFQPDLDLRDAPNGKTISRQHGTLFRRGTAWYLRVESSARNSTFLNGAPLQRGQEVPLSDGDQLRMGNAVATFHQEKPAQYVDSDLLDLVFGPPTDVTLEAGSAQAVSLTLVNFSGRVERFDLDVGGIAPEWWRMVLPDGTTSTPGQLPQVRLDTTVAPVPHPRATARLSLVLTPPRTPSTRAGIYPLLISATGLDARRLRRTATGQLIVKPFESLRLTLQPSRISGRRGRLRLGVYNDGNAPAVVSLKVDTDKHVEAKLDQTEISLPNGGEALVDLHLRLKHRPWLGPEVVYPAIVNATAGEQTQTQQAMLACPPRIPIPIQRLLGRIQSDLKPIVAVLAVLALLLVAGYFWLLPPAIALVPDTPLVTTGGSTTLSWNVHRGEGQGVLEGPSGSQQASLPSGSLSVSPDQTTDYKLTAKNIIGLATTTTASVKVLRVLSFTATPDTLKKPGDPVVLEWKTENATGVRIEPSDELPSPLTGTKVTVHPQTSTTYHLVASNDQAKTPASGDARVVFSTSSIGQFQPDHQQVFPGDPVTLTWVADGFVQLTLKGSPGDLELNGADQDVTLRRSIVVRPVHSGSYTLVATNADGATIEAQTNITIMPIKTPRLQPLAKPISAGESAKLEWVVEGANDRAKLVLQPDGGDPLDVSGRTSIDVRPDQSTQYTLQVTGADGQTLTSDPVMVPVLPSIQAFTVLPATINEGDAVVLTWNAVDADSVTITRDDGARFVGKASDETRDHPPATVTSYTISAHNATGDSVPNATAVVKIKVQPPPTPLPLPLLPPQTGV